MDPIPGQARTSQGTVENRPFGIDASGSEALVSHSASFVMVDYLLDTDVSVDLINGTVSGWGLPSGASVGISSITAYELQVGLEKSHSKKTKAETRSFLEAIPTFEFEEKAALESAKVRTELESSGRGIGPYDTLIAGHCRQLGCTLVTRNKREFERVRGLVCHDSD